MLRLTVFRRQRSFHTRPGRQLVFDKKRKNGTVQGLLNKLDMLQKLAYW